MNQQQSAAQSTSNTAQGQKKFFDLHTRGVGYLNRVRMVTTKGKGGRRGDSFLACAVNALHGDSEDPNTSLFDCRVSGKDAQDIVQALLPAVEDNKKVIIGFAIGDIYAHVYERKSKVRDANNQWKETGESETTALIKGRLLQITYAKINGDVVYRINEDGLVQTSLMLPESAEDQGADEHSNARTGTHG